MKTLYNSWNNTRHINEVCLYGENEWKLNTGETNINVCEKDVLCISTISPEGGWISREKERESARARTYL